MADDSEQELLLESGPSESENRTVDEGLIVELSRRDSSSVTTRGPSRRRRSNTEVRECNYRHTSDS